MYPDTQNRLHIPGIGMTVEVILEGRSSVDYPGATGTFTDALHNFPVYLSESA